MMSIRTSAFALLVLFGAACESPRSTTVRAAPEPTSVAPVRDRTIWDGLPARSAAAAATGSPHGAREPRAAPVVAPAPTVRGLRFDHEPLDAALKRLQLVTGAPILVTPQGLALIRERALTVDLDVTAPLRLDQVLDLFARQSAELDWTVRDGVVWFTTQADARGPMRLRMFDVRDLVMARPDLPAPHIRGLPTGGDDRGGAQDPESRRAMEPDVLVGLIKDATDPRYWEETEGASIEITDDGILLVRADEQMLGRIGGAVRPRR